MVDLSNNPVTRTHFKNQIAVNDKHPKHTGHILFGGFLRGEGHNHSCNNQWKKD